MSFGIQTFYLATIVYRKLVPNLFKAAGVDGYFTNHFLRATNATHLFEAHVDEQLIMERTGYSSTAVRSYKRIGNKLNSATSDALNKSISTTTNEVRREQGMKDTTMNETMSPLNFAGA